MKTQLKLIITGFIFLICISELSAQMKFKDLVRHPVLTYGDEGEWDDGVVFTPAVVKDGDTLRIWYTGFDEDLWTSPLHGKIGYAWSTDGITWHKHSQNPVLFAEFEWEGNSLFRCAVIKDADTFKMWYGADGPPGGIGYATSVDGIDWNKHPAPILLQGPPLEWDDDGISPTTVIKEAEVYKMWYYGNRPGFPMEESKPQCGLATSPDGINWTKYDDPETPDAPYAYSDPVLKVGPAGSWDSHRAFEPLVLKQDTGGYFMMYSGLKAPVNTATKQQKGYAYSSDGIHWEKDENNPTIKDDHSFVEWGRTIYSGSALHYDNKIHYWFACFHTPPYEARPQIGYAVQLISCLPESFEFTTQAEIDSFQTNCNNCNEINENVIINGDDITNLDGLSNLTSIDNKLEIDECPSLTNLSGFENLNSVEHIEIYNNASLLNLNGLNNLTSLRGHIYLTNNSSLINLSGLEGLDSIMELRIMNNDALSSLSGLDNLTTLTGLVIYGSNLYINDNDALISLTGLENLTSLHKGIEGWESRIWIEGNDALVSLEGIENIDAETLQHLSITNNPSLSVCDAQWVCNILSDTSTGIFINNNAPGCNNQEEVEEDCNNNCLPGGFSPYYQEDIDNFPSQHEGCNEISGSVSISSSLITNLDSLYVIESIGGNLSISDCNNLQGLSGLDNITNIAGNLTIRNNENLSMCDTYGICNYLTNPNGEINIENNADGCESTNQVLDSCSINAVNEHTFANKIKLNPNPFTTSTTLLYELQHPEKVILTIYDHLGKQVYQYQENQARGQHQLIWNAERLPAGIYFCVLKTNQGTQTTKLIKLNN